MNNIYALKDLPSLCANYLEQMSDRQIVLMYGQLGVGKTEVVKHFLKLLGYDEASSPSFAMINHYTTPARNVAHVDLYRIKNDEDLESIGFWDLFAQPKALIFIEWAERLKPEDLPPNWKRASWSLDFLPKAEKTSVSDQNDSHRSIIIE